MAAHTLIDRQTIDATLQQLKTVQKAQKELNSKNT